MGYNQAQQFARDVSNEFASMAVPPVRQSLDELAIPPVATKLLREQNLSVSYKKHPVTHFCCVSDSGVCVAIDISRAPVNSNESDPTGKICIVNRGQVGGEQRFQIQIAGNESWAIRTSNGSNLYSFMQIGANSSSPLSIETIAERLYKGYQAFYSSGQGSDAKCHKEAVDKIVIGKSNGLLADVAEVINSWAKNSQTEDSRAYFSRFAASIT